MIKENEKIYITEFPSSFTPKSLGGIFFVATVKGLSNLVVCNNKSEFDDFLSSMYSDRNITSSAEPFKVVIENLKKYFNNKDFDFSFPLDLKVTDFQKNVWMGIQQISFGKTKSYKELALSIGSEGAVRATGSACGRNPIPIIIPCHRVISSDGSIGGFSLGLDKKEILLKIEGISL